MAECLDFLSKLGRSLPTRQQGYIRDYVRSAGDLVSATERKDQVQDSASSNAELAYGLIVRPAVVNEVRASFLDGGNIERTSASLQKSNAAVVVVHRTAPRPSP